MPGDQRREGLLGFVERDDAGMVELRQCLGLAGEAFGEGRVVAASEHDDRMRGGHCANVLQSVAIGQSHIDDDQIRLGPFDGLGKLQIVGRTQDFSIAGFGKLLLERSPAIWIHVDEQDLERHENSHITELKARQFCSLRQVRDGVFADAGALS